MLLRQPLTLEQVKQIAEDLLEGLRQPFHHQDRLLGTKASIGIAASPFMIRTRNNFSRTPISLSTEPSAWGETAP